jgi:DNA-binding transcriptional regulator YiaG
MAKRKQARRTTADKIAAIEAQIEELKSIAKESSVFSPKAIRAERRRLELSAKAYAELVGVSMITIYSWEYGRCGPRADQFQKWLAVRGISKEAAWKKLGLTELRRFSSEDVRAERKRLGLSTQKYGDLVGVRKLAILNWEQGKAVPRESSMVKWLAVKGIGKAAAYKRLGLS